MKGKAIFPVVAGLVTINSALLNAFPAQAIEFDTFNDFDAWTEAVDDFFIVEENFSNDIPSALAIEFDSGIVSTNSAPGFNSFPGLGEADNRVNSDFEQYTNCVDSNGVICSQQWTWTFPTDIVGFGFNIFGASEGRLAIRGDFGNGEQAINVSETIDPNAVGINSGVGFFGVTGSDSFNSVTFFSRAGNDFINLDPLGTSNPPVVFAKAGSQGPKSVPEPGSILGFAAIVALGAVSRRRFA